MATFIEPAGLFDYYIQFVKENKIEVRGGVIVNPCTIGEVYTNEKEGLCVATGKGVIAITEIQAPNSKRMFINDYLRGNKITVGKILL